MSEISKAVGQWVLSNVGWTVIIILFLLSCFFKMVKKEIDPLGWVIGLFGKALTRDVRKDVAEFKKDYNQKITALRSDLDGFEKKTNNNLAGMKKGTDLNCRMLKKRMDAMEKSNDLQSIRQIRAHVLDFANSCMNGRKHTMKDFDNIFDENQEYQALVKKHKIKNDKYKEDYEFIVKVYHKCQENNSFLKETDANV
jgi:hypothetical protein